MAQTMRSMGKIPTKNVREPLPAAHENGYAPVIRVTSTIPWGYEKDPDDDQVLLPIPDQLDLLARAMKYLKTGKYSYEEIANWLSTRSGRYISKVGLIYRLETQKRRRRAYINHDNLARASFKAAKKAEKLEQQLLGQTYEEIYPGRKRLYTNCTCGALAGVNDGSEADSFNVEKYRLAPKGRDNIPT